MDRSSKILRIEIDGVWTAEDFGQAMQSLSDLYDLRLVLELLRDDQREWERKAEEFFSFFPTRRRWARGASAGLFPWGPTPPLSLSDQQLSNLGQLLQIEERLRVWQVRFASPGIADLAGVGVVIGHLKDFVLRLVEHYGSRHQRRLGEEKAELENEKLRIENARSLVGLANELGFSGTDLRRLIAHVDSRQEVLAKLVDGRKLRRVSTPKDSREE